MINVMTQKPLRVLGEDSEWPAISLPVSQLSEAQQLLDERGVPYTVDENYLSINDGPFTALIKLRRGTDGKAVQAILDGVA